MFFLMFGFLFNTLEQPPQDPISKSTFDSFFSGDKSLIGDLTSIKLMGVPRELNNKDFLRKFYEKFGVVKRVFCHPISNSAIITFDDHVSLNMLYDAAVMLSSNIFPFFV